MNIVWKNHLQLTYQIYIDMNVIKNHINVTLNVIYVYTNKIKIKMIKIFFQKTNLIFKITQVKVKVKNVTCLKQSYKLFRVWQIRSEWKISEIRLFVSKFDI